MTMSNFFFPMNSANRVGFDVLVLFHENLQAVIFLERLL